MMNKHHIVIILCILGIASIFLFFIQSEHQVLCRKEVSFEIGLPIDLDDIFLFEHLSYEQREMLKQKITIDSSYTSQVGTSLLKFNYEGYVYEITIHMIDTVAPIINCTDIAIDTETRSFHIDDYITIIDESLCQVSVDDRSVHYGVVGEYAIDIKAIDEGRNETTIKSTVTIKEKEEQDTAIQSSDNQTDALTQDSSTTSHATHEVSLLPKQDPVHQQTQSTTPTNEQNAIKDVVSLTLSKSNERMKLGEKIQVIATLNGLNDNVIWSSSKQSVASVVDGVITARSVGSAVITAQVADLKQTCHITVVQDDVIWALTDDDMIQYAKDVITSLGFEWAQEMTKDSSGWSTPYIVKYTDRADDIKQAIQDDILAKAKRLDQNQGGMKLLIENEGQEKKRLYILY